MKGRRIWEEPAYRPARRRDLVRAATNTTLYTRVARRATGRDPEDGCMAKPRRAWRRSARWTRLVQSDLPTDYWLHTHLVLLLGLYALVYRAGLPYEVGVRVAARRRSGARI